MPLKELHRQAIEKGGDAVILAIGKANAMLQKNPYDYLALSYKSSLLTMIDHDLLPYEKRQKYFQIALKLIEIALHEAADKPSLEAEVHYISATTIAMLPTSEKLEARAWRLLIKLIVSELFVKLDDYQQARTLSLASCFVLQDEDKQLSIALFKRARQINCQIAVETYVSWLERNK